MQSTVFKSVSFLILSLFVISSCDTTDPFTIPPPDFSTVPDAFDYSSLEPVEVEEGILAYIHEEGTGNASVTLRDEVSVEMSLRTLDGEIIYSSFYNGFVDPITLTVGAISLNPQIFSYSVGLSYTEGLKRGLIGMKEGEVRTLIVSPEKGYADMPSSAVNGQYQETTLQYDIKLVRISY